MVKEPTHIIDVSCSLLDLLFSNKSFNNCSASVQFGISGHKLEFLRCDRSVYQYKLAEPNVYCNFERADDKSVINELEQRFKSFD